MSEEQNPSARKQTGALSPPKPISGNTTRQSSSRPAAPPQPLQQNPAGQNEAIQGTPPSQIQAARDDREDEYRTPRDSALLEGWRRYQAFSEASKRQKGLYNRLRTGIIFLSLLASVVAAFATTGFIQDENNVLLQEIFRVALIGMPIIIAGAMTYATEFTPNSAWIIYRVAAQQILHEIYRYRMESGVYSDNSLTAGARQELFLRRITKHTNEITQTLTTEETATIEPVLLEYEEEAKIAEYAGKKRAGDGFSPMNSEQYITTRIISQRNWYIKKLQEDYRTLRTTRFFVLLCAGAGSVIAGIDIRWAFVVVITTALVTAITTWMQLKMQGQTYGHYNLTATTLDNILSDWYILSDADREKPAMLAELVNQVEAVLENEERAWMEQAIQSQMLAQQSMERTLANLPGGSFDDDDESYATMVRRAQAGSYNAFSAAGSTNTVIQPGVDDEAVPPTSLMG